MVSNMNLFLGTSHLDITPPTCGDWSDGRKALSSRLGDTGDVSCMWDKPPGHYSTHLWWLVWWWEGFVLKARWHRGSKLYVGTSHLDITLPTCCDWSDDGKALSSRPGDTGDVSCMWDKPPGHYSTHLWWLVWWREGLVLKARWHRGS